jgi:hypothetical protein
MNHYTLDEIRALIDPVGATVIVNRWLARGDGIAVYRNVDFGSSEFGDTKFVSYGSPAAQLEVDVPPQTLPDIGNVINWRYQLQGVYKGGAL